MKKIKFDAHGGSAPAYMCSEPGDNTGWYYQSADVDDVFKEAAKAIRELCDHMDIPHPAGTLARLSVGSVETEVNHEQEPVYACCGWTQVEDGLFETDCGHRDRAEPNQDWVCCPYCGEVITDVH